MLALVLIFVLTLLISFVAVRFYRVIAGWSGFSGDILGRSGSNMMMTVKTQQGFITINPKSKDRERKSRLRSPKGGIKAPWGW
jgi:hypothetical protein